jgi:hypothetical protein
MEVEKREIFLVYIVLQKSSKQPQKKQGDRQEGGWKGDEFRENGQILSSSILPGLVIISS